MDHDHSPQAIHKRLSQGPGHNYLRDFVYGGIDGAVTTFAVVSGVVGAELSSGVILVLGAANLFADGFSMAASNYLATKTEREDAEHLEAIEKHHIEAFPDGEREEVRQIFKAKGLAGNELERVVDLLTKDRNVWVRTMLTEEYGLPWEIRSPWRAGLATFGAFLVCGLVPLVPFILSLTGAFWLSTALTGGVFFAIGSVKSQWSTISWWRSGLETLAIGGVAAALAYGVGVMLKGLVGPA
jgi:VIT1/CCC1 family predicted Fe2+/Mn2+ transporter